MFSRKEGTKSETTSEIGDDATSITHSPSPSPSSTRHFSGWAVVPLAFVVACALLFAVRIGAQASTEGRAVVNSIQGPVYVEPTTEAWDDKYVDKYVWVTALDCAPNTVNYWDGLYLEGDDEYNEWAQLPETSALKSTCQEVEHARHHYTFCDVGAVTHAACSGTAVNKTYFNELGYRGQDCWSWEQLQDYMGEPDDEPDPGMCKTARRLNTPGCQEDSTMAAEYDAAKIGGYDNFQTSI
jgi:hypothetical protein